MELATVIKYSEALENAQNNFKLLPNGVYEAILQIKSIQNTKKGTYLQCCWELVKPLKGGYSKYVWQNLYVYGDEKTLSYSMRFINSLMKCVGITEFKDTDQLDGAMAYITVSTEKGQNGYTDRNRIDRIEPIDINYTKGSDVVKKVQADLCGDDFTGVMDQIRDLREQEESNDNAPF